MQCEIRQQDQIDAQKWNEFVRANSMGWAYHLYEMIGFDRYGSYINCSFAIVDTDCDEQILFVMQLHKTNKYPVLSRLHLVREKLHSRWGYVLKDGLPKKQFRRVKECFEKYIDSMIAQNNIKYLDIDLAPLTRFAIESRSAINPLIFMNFKPLVRYSYAVDLSKPDDRMLADCEETTRQAVRKIGASGKYSIVEAGPDEKDCRAYIGLHKETYTRTGAKRDIIADSYHHNMFFNLIPKGICRVFFLTELESGDTVAAVSILIYGDTAYYWWGDSKDDKEVGVNKYLLFKVICIIREQFDKKGYFETGGAYPYLRKGKSKGLNDFKKCFGTFLVPVYGGRYSKLK